MLSWGTVAIFWDVESSETFPRNVSLNLKNQSEIHNRGFNHLICKSSFYVLVPMSFLPQKMEMKWVEFFSNLFQAVHNGSQAKSIPKTSSQHPKRLRASSCSMADESFTERNLFVHKIPQKATKGDIFEALSRLISCCSLSCLKDIRSVFATNASIAHSILILWGLVWLKP